MLKELWDGKGRDKGCLSCALNGMWKFTSYSREERALYTEGMVYRSMLDVEQKELDVAGVRAE